MSRKMVVPIVFATRHGIQQFDDILHVMSMCHSEKLEYSYERHECSCVCGATYPRVKRDDGMELGPFITVTEDNGENITRWAAAWMGASVIVSIS